MLSAKLARRARPPLGVCQPQGLVFPFTSVVERMISLPGSRIEAGFELVAAAPARSSQQSAASASDAERRETQDFIEDSGKRVGTGEKSRPEDYGPLRGTVKIFGSPEARLNPRSCTPLTSIGRAGGYSSRR